MCANRNKNCQRTVIHLSSLLLDNSLGPLIVELQPLLNNKTIISAVETLPQSIRLLKSMAQILTKPEIKALFGMFARDERNLTSNVIMLYMEL